MKINTFVYEACIANNVPLPTLPVFQRKTFAQSGEDLIIASLLRAFANRMHENVEDMTFLEIGGNCPISTSATYLLATELKMKGVIVEANPSLIDNLRRVRTESKILHYAVTPDECTHAKLYLSLASELSSLWKNFVDEWPGGMGQGVEKTIMVPAITLPQIMEIYFPQKAPTFLSLDIEGMDLYVLKSLDMHRYRPAVIQIEPSDHFIYHESENIHKHMIDHEYILIAETDVNQIYMDGKIHANV